MSSIDIKYSAHAKAIPPRPIRLDTDGWAGKAEKMIDGSEPQPWHCLPYVEGNIYGLELIYPYETECRVIGENGTIRFDFDYTKEPGGGLTGGEFMAFAPLVASRYYLFNARLDLQAPPGYVLRTEPHPRYFTDETGTVPLSMIAHLQSEWWPKKLFIVFRAPPQGQQHIFRKGEAYAQVLFVPHEMKYNLVALGEAEEAYRRQLELDIGYSRAQIASNVWHNPMGSEFGNHYKMLARTFASDGMEGVDQLVMQAKASRNRELPLDKSPAECLATAHQYVGEKRYEDARAIYVYILGQDANNAEAMCQLGICTACLGAPNAGLQMMSRAVSMRPDVAAFRVNLAEMLRLIGQISDAEKVLRTALQVMPDDLRVMASLASNLAQQARLDEAARIYRSIVARVTNDPVSHARLGRVLARLGRDDEARKHIERALAIDPNLAEAQAVLKQLPALGKAD